jgi:hypothetical protein
MRAALILAAMVVLAPPSWAQRPARGASDAEVRQAIIETSVGSYVSIRPRPRVLSAGIGPGVTASDRR